jgi:16S rRNA (cytidine1402-2'-O)-methyltransferase
MHLRHFVVENAKSARAFLKVLGYPQPLQSLELQMLNEHTPTSALKGLLAPLIRGVDCGLLSEAGCPAVADPGAALVRLAHDHGVRVVPLIGPSAPLLALMASGLNGQRFVFHGYLPTEPAKRHRKLREMEQDAEREDRTQICIEAPYRNQTLLNAILQTCRPDTVLCLAMDLTQPTEAIQTRSIQDWNEKQPHINRRPAVFLIYRAAGSYATRQKR